MKKIIYVLIGILLIGLATATFYASKEIAFNEFRTYKEAREAEKAKSINTMKYLTDKICTINYDSEKVYCYIEVEFTFDENIDRITVLLSSDTTAKEDDNVIKTNIREQIDWITERMNKEEFEYIERITNKGVINLK